MRKKRYTSCLSFKNNSTSLFKVTYLKFLNYYYNTVSNSSKMEKIYLKRRLGKTELVVTQPAIAPSRLPTIKRVLGFQNCSCKQLYLQPYNTPFPHTNPKQSFSFKSWFWGISVISINLFCATLYDQLIISIMSWGCRGFMLTSYTYFVQTHKHHFLFTQTLIVNFIVSFCFVGCKIHNDL